MIAVHPKALTLTLFVAASFAVRLGAQGLTGQISGTIADPSAAAVPNAMIELTNTATAQVRQTKTDPSGDHCHGASPGDL